MSNTYHNFINWKSYYKEDQIDKYNLRNTYCINLFNTNDFDMPGDNQINYLNPYLGELPMMYYVWKNNLKSDYICISQYRRDITYIDFDELDKGKIQCLDLWTNENGTELVGQHLLNKWDPLGYATEKLWSFLKKKYGYDDNSIENLKNKRLTVTTPVFVWAMKWEKYCELCEFIFGYLDEMFPNDEWKNHDRMLLFQNKQKNAFYRRYPGENDFTVTIDRYIVHIVEEVLIVMLSFFFDVFKNNELMNKTHIYTEIGEESDYSDVVRFYHKNVKCNPFDIVVKCKDKKTYDNVKKFFNEDWAKWEFYKLKIITNSEQYDSNAFKLRIDEYIDLDHPIDLHQGKYNIKKFFTKK